MKEIINVVHWKDDKSITITYIDGSKEDIYNLNNILQHLNFNDSVRFFEGELNKNRPYVSQISKNEFNKLRVVYGTKNSRN